MNAIIEHLPADVHSLRKIADLQLMTLQVRDAEITQLVGQLMAIRAAANGDLDPEIGTETLVRRMHAELEDAKQENSKLRRQLMKSTAHPLGHGGGE